MASDMQKALAFFAKRIPEYQRDPVLFVREVLRAEPDPWQEAVLRDLADTECKRVSVRSGQGVGKTALQAWCVLWFLTCFPFARVVATATMLKQLNDILWPEVAKWLARNPLLEMMLKWDSTYVRVRRYRELWFATTKTAVKPETMQGFHADHMLFLVDEASGVPDPILEAILGTITGRHNKILMCGNPNYATGIFYDSFMNPVTTNMFRCHHISSEDVPRTDKENIAMLEAKYGRDSNFFRVRVLGEFPLEDDDAFIPLQLINRAVYCDPPEIDRPATIDIACDVARYGDDSTVIGCKLDGVFSIHSKRRGQDTMRTADRIVELGEQLVRKYRYENEIIPVKIDDTGVGGGVTDRLRQIKNNDPERFRWMYVLPAQFGQPLKHNRLYYDTTTLWMSIVRNMLRGEDEDGNEIPDRLVLPDDQELIAQLSTRKYDMTENSRVRVESKKKMKERGMGSPDEADCLLMACIPVNREKIRRMTR